MDDAVLISDGEPYGDVDNARAPIVARGYIYKKGQGLKSMAWLRLYVVLKGNGIYFYESEEEFLNKNSGGGHKLLKGEERIGNEHIQEESHIALTGFRGSSTHDIRGGILEQLGMEITIGTGGRFLRPKIEIKFDPQYTSADSSKGSGNFRSDEIIFSVLGYHDSVEEARKNSEVTINQLFNIEGELMTRATDGGAASFVDPPFFVLLYNEINRIIKGVPKSSEPDTRQELEPDTRHELEPA